MGRWVYMQDVVGKSTALVRGQSRAKECSQREGTVEELGEMATTDRDFLGSVRRAFFLIPVFLLLSIVLSSSHATHTVSYGFKLRLRAPPHYGIKMVNKIPI